MATWKQIKEGNYKLLSGMTGDKPKDFARIRSFNDKNSAITHDGVRVERLEFLFIEGYGMVKNLPTSLHFCYEDTSKKLGRWVYMCSCGSPGGVISYNELKNIMTVDGTEVGYVLACLAGVASKQNTGIFRHADGSTE